MSHSHSSNQAELAPYAVRDCATRGRIYPHGAHSFRNPFQRDRDRIIHCRAFRRLDGKTQVFLNGTGDHYRTRLTHTIEVAAIARTLARRLGVNEDLTEAIGLAHDLGHTPFGHVGERALDALLGLEHGGFDHNLHSLRVVDCLEVKYPGFDGLNLTWEVRAGLLKHRDPPVALDGIELPPQPPLEAQIADVADDLAYYTHDIDDGLEGGLINDDLLAGVELWRRAREHALADGARTDSPSMVPFTVRCLIDMLVGDVIAHSTAQLEAARPVGPEDVQNRATPIIGFTPEFQDLNTRLREFLFTHVYWHPDVARVNRRAEEVVQDLYAHFIRNPSEIGPGTQRRIHRFGLHRCVADYIAGMTDRFALDIHRRLP